MGILTEPNRAHAFAGLGRAELRAEREHDQRGRPDTPQQDPRVGRKGEITRRKVSKSSIFVVEYLRPQCTRKEKKQGFNSGESPIRVGLRDNYHLKLD